MSFARRYSDPQRDAIAGAVLTDGLTCRDAVERAAAGTLAPGLDAFEMPLSTARDLVAKRRRHRDLERARDVGATSTIGEIADDLAALVSAETRRIKRAARRGSVDSVRVRDAARAAREVLALQRAARAADGRSPGQRDNGDGTHPAGARDNADAPHTLADRIAAGLADPSAGRANGDGASGRSAGSVATGAG